MNLGSRAHGATVKKSSLMKSVQKLTTSRVGGPFLVQPKGTASETLESHVLGGKGLPHVRRHAELGDGGVEGGVSRGRSAVFEGWAVDEERGVFRDHDGEVERGRLEEGDVGEVELVDDGLSAECAGDCKFVEAWGEQGYDFDPAVCDGPGLGWEGCICAISGFNCCEVIAGAGTGRISSFDDYAALVEDDVRRVSFR